MGVKSNNKKEEKMENLSLDYILSQIKINIEHFEKTAINQFITTRGRANAVRKLKKLSLLKIRVEQQQLKG